MQDKPRPLVEYGIEVWWEGGFATSVTYHLEDMEKAGIKKPMMFIKGHRDARTDNGFNESHEDYIKGFKYAVTGKID